MKRITILYLAFIFAALDAFTQGTNNIIIPQPNRIETTNGKFNLPEKLTISSDTKEFNHAIEVFSAQVSKYSKAEISKKKGKADIQLIKADTKGTDESYRLKITRDAIYVEAVSSAGAFYGLQSIVQLLIHAQQNGETALQCCLIDDQPRYPWRGLMLDESRHFFGKEEVKKILDMMALHKLNKFHWHLTDEPAWRIEIKKYPLLTEIGGQGTNWDREAPARFYTQEEIKEIVNYAAERYIEVIPEIDMPGHATAAVRAYPEFSGGGSEKFPDFTFHPAKDETYTFLTNILREVAGLFPSQYIHIGGDEVSFGNQQWSGFPEVRELMEKEGLKDLLAVEHYFVKRMADSIQNFNKKIIGWDEVSIAGLNKENTMVMWWRHDKPQVLKDAVEKGYETILCPRRPLYFDFVQHDSHTDGRRWGGFCPIEDVYAFPNLQMTGGEYYKDQLVKGIQANVWTETMHTPERLEFMIFPRLSALAEAAWTDDSKKDYNGFTNRLLWMLGFYEKEGIQYFDPLNPERKKEIKGVEKEK
jgi:hexosaminidase